MAMAFCEMAIRFEIDGHQVEHKTSFSHVPRAGIADKGFIFGNLACEICQALKDHLPPNEWESFLLSLTQLHEASAVQAESKETE